jgi:hypothetical protein
MSRVARVARARWPIAALLAGSVAALILALVPARADALEGDGYCAATGFFFCYKPEFGVNQFGQWEIRMYVAHDNWLPWIL